MRTIGVDLSVSEKDTAAAAIEWEEGRARVGETSLGLGDAELLERLVEADWVAIDAPFGWPEPMVLALRDYAAQGRWPEIAKQDFRYRRTDSFVREHVAAEVERKLSPLSVSSDRIALTAWRLAGLREAAFERSGIRFDRTGADRVVEAYPAAALLLWGLERSGYKTGQRRDPERREAAEEVREALLASIEEQAPWLDWAPGAWEACVASDDALDAVLCALIARAAALDLTALPSAKDLERARGEGWIHLPAKGSLGWLAEGAPALTTNP